MNPPVLMQRVAIAAHLVLTLAVALRAPSALSVLLAAILLFPLPGLWRGRTYTAAWASMVVAFYVAGYLADGYARSDGRAMSFLIASVAAIDYLSLMLFVRFRAREVAAQRAAVVGSDGDGAT